jgi:lipopolysaccharide/colanic/teichoic acid biosynthesis glycosyltransferase
MQIAKERANMRMLTSSIVLVPDHRLTPIAREAPRPHRLVPPSMYAIKRAGDLIIGSILALIALPVIALAALGIMLVTGGAPFFAQERVAQNGRRFRMYKLRTMVKGAHEMRDDLMHLNEADGPIFKIRQDPRLHPLGALLRRTSIDELPNLFNVVLGDISLVGPRPALPCEVEHYDAYATRRLTVPQGVTCLWQINGRSSVCFDEWMELDNRYIDTWTPLRDIRILLKTIPAVILKDGAH